MATTDLQPRVLLPRRVHDALRAGVEGESFDAIALFVDLSGFTAMSERLMVRGQHGAELLAGALRDFFGPHVATVQDHGGFIVGFAGDAFSALFPHAPGAGPDAAARAAAAARQIASAVAAAPSASVGGEDFAFAVKLGLGRGPARWRLHAGSGQVLFSGGALEASAAAERHCARGEITVHRDVIDLLPPDLRWSPRGTEHARLDGAPPDRLPAATPAPPWTPDLGVLRRIAPEALLDPHRSAEFRWVVTAFMAVDIDDDEHALAAFLDTAAPLCARLGGHLGHAEVGDKGCTLVWFWGAPLAVERDLPRAADFLLALREAIDEAGGPAFRVGLTHHRMYVGLAGHPRREAMACYGRGVTLAARLCMAAPWGATWVDGHAARGLEGHAQLTARPPRRLKGYAEPVPMWALEGRGAPREAAGVRPLSGRTAELARLRRHLAPLQAAPPGPAGGVVVLGEPGVGKSHLVAAARHRTDTRVAWLTGACDPLHRPALHPFRALVANALDMAARGDAAALVEGLHRLVGSEDPGEHAAILVGWSGLAPPGELWDRLEPRGRARRLRSTLLWLFERAARRRPTVLHIEDIHWLDDASRALLGALRDAARAGGWPLGFVFTSRPVEGGAPATAWPTGDPPAPIALDGLTVAGTQGVVEASLGAPCAPDLAAHLHRRSGGNPLFAQQLALALRESGRLAEGGQGLALDGPADDGLPARIDQLLVARLDRLARPARRAVLGAAVLGLVFHPGVHDRMLGQDADDARQAAARHGVLTPEGPGAWRFTHGLMRDAAYDMQPLSRRREAHRRAAEALREQHGERGRAQAEIAHHFEEAGDEDAALEHLTRARDHARSVHDPADAMRHCARIRELTRGRPEPAWIALRHETLTTAAVLHENAAQAGAAAELLAQELGAPGPGLDGLLAARDGLLAAGPARFERGALLLQWMLLLQRTEGVRPATWAALADIRAILEAAGPDDRDCRALLAKTLRYMAIFANDLGRLQDSMDLCRATLALIDEGHEARYRGATLHSLAIATHKSGDLREAIRLSTEAVAEFRALDQLTFLGIGLNLLGNLRFFHGDTEGAIAAYEASGAAAQRSGATAFRALSSRNLAEASLIRGDLERAERAIAQVHTLLPHGTPRDRIGLQRVQAIRLRLMGDPQAALDTALAAQAEAEQVESPASRPAYAREVGRSLAALGREDEARGVLERVARAYEEREAQHQHGAVVVDLARIAPPAEAIARLTPWIARWRTEERRVDLAEALLVRARAAHALGDVDQARADRDELATRVAAMGLLPRSALAQGLAALDV